MQFKDFCEWVNESFGNKFTQSDFIFNLFDSAGSIRFSDKYESDINYASKLYSEKGRDFKNAKKHLQAIINPKKVINFFKDNFIKDTDDLFNNFEIVTEYKDLDLLSETVYLIFQKMIDSENGDTYTTFNTVYQKLLSQKGIKKEVYKTYLDKCRKKLNNVKTILFDDVSFYDIYIANDIAIVKALDGISPFKEKIEILKGNIASTKEFVEKYGHYVSISAPGGYGKSMFMRHLLLCDGLPSKYKIESSNLIPVLVSAKRYKGSSTKLLSLIYEVINSYVDLDYNEFINDLKKGYFLLLFDGLDEIKIDLQTQFIDELNQITIKYENNYFVTSERPSELVCNQIGYKNLTLEGLNKDRAKAMILKMPNYDTDIKEKFASDLEFSWYRYQSICENPLLLNVMFLVYKEKDRQLPVKLYKFYDDAYEVMFEKHNSIQNHKREYKTKLGQTDLKNIISEFCYRLYSEQEFDFDTRKVSKIFKNSKSLSCVSVDDFIFDFSTNLNLVYQEEGKYKFIHRLFQEFFTANYFSLLNDEDYNELPKWFENISSKRSKFFWTIRGSNILKMLYEMDETRCMNVIIKPILIKYIEPNYSKDNCLKYYSKSLRNLLISEMESSCLKDHMLTLICDALDIKCDFHIGLCKSIDESYICDYIIGQIEDEDENGRPICTAIQKSYVDEQLSKLSDSEQDEYMKTIVDYNDKSYPEYMVPIQDIIDSPNDFKELLEIIFSSEPNNGFRIHYQQLFDLLYK